MKNIPYKTACTHCLPDDEPMSFETWTSRRRQKLNENINLKCVNFVCLRYIIVSQCTVKKHKIIKVSFFQRVVRLYIRK